MTRRKSLLMVASLAILAAPILEATSAHTQARTRESMPLLPVVPNPAEMGSANIDCELLLKGRVFVDGEPIPAAARVVRLKLRDTIIPLVLDGNRGRPGDPFSQAMRSEQMMEAYQSILTKTVMVSVDRRSDEIQLEEHHHSTDRLRVEGCSRGFLMPIFAISSVRRSH